MWFPTGWAYGLPSDGQFDDAKTSLRLARSEANATRGMLDKQVPVYEP